MREGKGREGVTLTDMEVKTERDTNRKRDILETHRREKGRGGCGEKRENDYER